MTARFPGPLGLRVLVGRLPSRARWTIGDQLVSSLSSFLVIAAVAHGSSVSEFGAFSLSYLLYGVVLGTGRAIGGEILLLRAAASPADAQADSQRLLFVAGVLGTACGLALLAISGVAGDPVAPTMRAFAVALPIILVQDALRYCFFAARRPRGALLSDAAWTVAQVAAFAIILAVRPSAGPVLLVLGWAAGAAVGIAVALLRRPLRPRRDALDVWLRSDRARVGSFLADFVLLTGSVYLSTYAIAGLSGLGAVGAVRGALFVFSPFDSVVAGLRIFALPALGGALLRGARTMRTTARSISVAFGALACAYGVAATLLPSRLGRLLLGATWHDSRPLLSAVAVVYVARTMAIPAMDGIRALGGGRRLVRLRATVAVLTLAAVVAGAAIADARGAVDGMALGFCVSAALWWLGFLRGSRGDTPAPARAPTAAG